MGNLPNDLNVRTHLTSLFIKRNKEQKGSLSWAPMTTALWVEQAMERQHYEAYEAPLLCLPIIHSGPGGVKVSAKTFTPPVHLNREMEWWKENTRGDGGGQVALLMTLECDGNAVNEKGWDKKLCFPRRDCQAWEEPEEHLCLAVWLQLSETLQSSADHRSVGWTKFECEAGKMASRMCSSFFFPPLFPLIAERQWQLKIRMVGDGKWTEVGERRRRETVNLGGHISSQQFHWGSHHCSSVSISRWKINNLFRQPPSPLREKESFPKSSVHIPCSYLCLLSLNLFSHTVTCIFCLYTVCSVDIDGLSIVMLHRNDETIFKY